jgi:hypothetical protein
MQSGESLASVLPLTEQNIRDMDEPSLAKFVAAATALVGTAGPLKDTAGPLKDTAGSLKDSLLLVYELLANGPAERRGNRKTVTQAINEFDPEIRETLQANLARFEGLSRDTLESRIRSIRAPARKLLDDDPEKLYEFIVLALLLRDKAAFQSPEYHKHANSLMNIIRVLKEHGLATDRASGKSKSGIEQIQALPEPVRPQLEASWRQHESKSYEELQAVDDALSDKLKDDYSLNKALRKTSERMVRNTSVVDVLKVEAVANCSLSAWP